MKISKKQKQEIAELARNRMERIQNPTFGQVGRIVCAAYKKVTGRREFDDPDNVKDRVFEQIAPGFVRAAMEYIDRLGRKYEKCTKAFRLHVKKLRPEQPKDTRPIGWVNLETVIDAMKAAGIEFDPAAKLKLRRYPNRQLVSFNDFVHKAVFD